MTEEYTEKGEEIPVFPVYVSKPNGKGPFPTIIVFMHAHGVDKAMRKVCDDLATQGYYAVSGDAYLNGTYGFESRSDEVIFAAFDLLLCWIENQDDIDQERMGLMGFCMGGRHTYLATADYPQFKAGVSYYGFPHRGSSPSDTPVEMVDEFNAPILSIFGSEDKGIPLEEVEKYKKISDDMEIGHHTIVFENAGHGFLNPFSRNHAPEASEKAWEMTISHFDTHIK